MNKFEDKRSVDIGQIALGCGLIVLIAVLATLFFRERLSGLIVNEIHSEMVEISRQNSIHVSDEIKRILGVMDRASSEIGRKGIANYNFKETPVSEMLKPFEFTRAGVVDITGKSYDGQSVNLLHFSGIKGSIQGNKKAVYASSTPFNDLNAMVFSVPIEKDGRITGAVYGILNYSALQSLLTIQSFNGRGESCVFDSEGTMFVHLKNRELSDELENVLNGWQKNNAKEDVANLYTKVRQDGRGVERITLSNGTEVYIACSNVADIRELYTADIITVAAVQNRINSILNSATFVMVILLLILLAGYSYTEMRQMRYQREIYNLAFRDKLTGLGNKKKYQYDMLLLANNQEEKKLAVISIDVRNMKVINDMMSFKYGDKLLVEVSSILAASVKEGEMCYRAGNDHFFLVLFSAGLEEDKSRLEKLLSRITDELSEERGHKVYLASGINIVDCQKVDNSNSEWPFDVASHAGLARKLTKQPNRNTIGVFDDKVARLMLDENALEEHFDCAVSRGEFVMYYQPKYSIAGDKPIMAGAEALVRWISPDREFMPPGVFIPLFERDGNIVRLDMHVLELVCRNLRHWMNAGYNVVNISVNISRQNIMRGNLFLDEAEAILNIYDIPKSMIEIEVLESGSEVDENILVSCLENIRKRGFSIAMDDFGRGYSSLGLFNHMPADCLKLDKSFFDKWYEGMPMKYTSLIKNIIQVAHDTGRIVVAEGIEEKFQVDLLKEFNCDLIQGYYFSKPLPVVDFQEKLGS